jgi:hypothetical protein
LRAKPHANLPLISADDAEWLHRSYHAPPSNAVAESSDAQEVAFHRHQFG